MDQDGGRREPEKVTAAEPVLKADRHAWYSLFILTLVYTLHYVDRAVFTVVQEPIKAEFHLSDSQLGILVGLIYGLTYALVGAPIGLLVDRLNRKRFLAAILAIWSGCTALGSLASSFMALAFVRTSVTAAEAGGSPTALSMISDLFPPKKRATALGTFFFAQPAATALIYIVGGMLAHTFGWRVVFLCAGAPGLVLAIVLLATVREPKRGAMDRAAPEEHAPSLKSVFAFARSQRAFGHVLAGLILINCSNGAIASWVLSFFIRNYQLSLPQAGLAVGIGLGLFGALGSLGAGPASEYMVKRDGRWLVWLPGLSGVFMTMAGVAMAFAPTIGLALAFFFLFDFMGRCHQGPGYSAALSLMRPRMRGLSISIVQVTASLCAAGLTPFLIGVLSDWYGGPDSLRYAIATGMVFSLWSAVHFFLAGRTLTADLERAGAV